MSGCRCPVPHWPGECDAPGYRVWTNDPARPCNACGTGMQACAKRVCCWRCAEDGLHPLLNPFATPENAEATS
jgi:hypothetical protein